MPQPKTYVGPKQKKKLNREEQVALERRNREEAAARRNAEERAARDAAANRIAQKKLETDRLKGEAIDRIRADWNRQINAIVAEVKTIRSAHPTVSGINAGDNGALGSTRGGTDSPVTLTVPANEYHIEKSEVLATMHGFDSSDSGYYKFRRDGVLVHCK